MYIQEILTEGKKIWGDEKLSLAQIIVRMGKVFGDVCRRERNAIKDKSTHTDEELKKELGNMIVASTRRCDDLGYDPDECVEIALNCQRKFQKE